jgi:hypothetical protein
MCTGVTYYLIKAGVLRNAVAQDGVVHQVTHEPFQLLIDAKLLRGGTLAV